MNLEDPSAPADLADLFRHHSYRPREGFDVGERGMIREIRLKRRHRHEPVRDGLEVGAVVRLPIVARFLDPEVGALARVQAPIHLGHMVAFGLHGHTHAADLAEWHVHIEKRP